jgi:ribosomal-protein-alanine N-acetyltransferase
MAHCDALAAIHKASFPRRQVWAVDAFALQLILPGVFGLIDPSGGLILVRAVADEAEVLTLAVIPAMRRRGVASALLHRAMAEAATRGAGSVFLEVSTRNAGAQALYRQLGFTEVGRRRRYYPDGSDALVLSVQLGGRSADLT